MDVESGSKQNMTSDLALAWPIAFWRCLPTLRFSLVVLLAAFGKYLSIIRCNNSSNTAISGSNFISKNASSWASTVSYFAASAPKIPATMGGTPNNAMMSLEFAWRSSMYWPSLLVWPGSMILTTSPIVAAILNAEPNAA